MFAADQEEQPLWGQLCSAAMMPPSPLSSGLQISLQCNAVHSVLEVSTSPATCEPVLPLLACSSTHTPTYPAAPCPCVMPPSVSVPLPWAKLLVALLPGPAAWPSSPA